VNLKSLFPIQNFNNSIMPIFQPDLSAATTAVIKALEQDYTQPLQTLIEYVRMNMLQPARQQLPDLHLLREVFNNESYTRTMTLIPCAWM
jgi:hypothetical protein